MNKRQLPEGAETRVATIELRAESDAPVIEGYAARFDTLSVPMFGFRETIAPGAFGEAIDNSDIRSLFNHDPNFILGRAPDTLRVTQDGTGLWTETDPPDTQLVRDMVLEPMRRGDLTQMSFAFRLAPNGDSWAEDDEGRVVRTINSVQELYDISPVTYPAYPDTTVAVRSLESILETEAERVRLRLAVAAERTRRVQLLGMDI